MLGYIIVGGFFAMVITGWIIFCIFKYKKWKRRFINCTRELTVCVVEVLEKKTHKGAILYKPIFKSTDYSDIPVIDTAYYSNLISFKAGEILQLMVNPNNIKEFIYKDKRYNKGLVADMLCCMGFLMIILFGVYLTIKNG